MATYKQKGTIICDAVLLTPTNYEDVCDFVGKGTLEQILAPKAITYLDCVTTPYMGVWIGNTNLGLRYCMERTVKVLVISERLPRAERLTVDILPRL